MSADHKQQARQARHLTVEVANGYGSPPDFGGFQLIYDAKVDIIEINSGADYSRARVWFPARRWHDRDSSWPRIDRGDRIRIKSGSTVVFSGFAMSFLSEFTGGSADGAYERNAVNCLDHKYLLDTTSPHFGILARGPDDYSNFGTDTQAAISSSATWLAGRRAIFNQDGLGNKSPDIYSLDTCDIPIFSGFDSGQYWTARDMIRYALSPAWNLAYRYLPIDDPEDLGGLDHSDWDRVLNNVVIDGLSALEAVELIAGQLGWSFREDYGSVGDATITFYKLAAADAYSRSSSNPTIKHRLHAPAAGEDISDAVAKGKKMLWSMTLEEDASRVINNPWGLGQPDRFEFTAELVPAWDDDDLVPDTSESNANLYFTDSQLQQLTDPDSKDYYKFYHPQGSLFLWPNVGRRWSLNEEGRYSDTETYDRGAPFAFEDVIPEDYIKSADGKRLYGLFSRQLLPALTLYADSRNTLGILVEFSFDGGTTWHTMLGSISTLEDECGIYIDQQNLAELVDPSNATISGGTLDGVQLNYWTSLCDDKLAGRSFKDGDWRTRCRVTASVQMDTRLALQRYPSADSGSPFWHRRIYDYSSKGYGVQKRAESSRLTDTSQPVWEKDSTDWMADQLDEIRRANEDQSISGQFTLERLWLEDFRLGDSIVEITGRDYDLSASYSGGTVYPEIVKIVIMPDRQRMQLITRDLRFAEVRL